MAVRLLRARMDPKNPMFSGSDEVLAALEGPAKCYFDTYVLPVLQFLEEGELYFGQGAEIRRDYESRAAGAQARQRAIDLGLMKGGA
jgi:hypothetical protein